MEQCDACRQEVTEVFHNEETGLALCEDCDLTSETAVMVTIQFKALTGHAAGILAKVIEDKIGELNAEYEDTDFEEA